MAYVPPFDRPLPAPGVRHARREERSAGMHALAWLGWGALLTVWPVVEVLIDLRVLTIKQAALILIAGCLGVVGPLLGDPLRRIAGMLWLLLLLYFASAFITFEYLGLTPHLYISVMFMEQNTLDAMRAYVLSLLALFPLLRTGWCLAYLRAHARAVATIAALPRWRILACCAVLIALGIADWLALGNVGIGAILRAERRTFAGGLLLATDHNLQVIAIPLSIVALVHAVMTRPPALSVLVGGTAVFAWMPTFLVGSRKEIFIISIAVLSIWLARRDGGRALAILFGLMLGFAAIPLVFGGDLALSLHEFVLPFYNVLIVNQFGDYVRPSTSFFELVQFLVPSELRISELRDFGTELYLLMRQFGQTVGYGGHPFAEVLAYDVGAPALVFLLVNAVLVGACAVLTRLNPVYALSALPYLALWGRSLFWITLFFILYSGLVMAVVTAGTGRRRPPA